MKYPVPPLDQQPVRLAISTLAFGGQGLARQGGPGGKVVFVQGGLPGETVEAAVTEVGRDFDRAVVRRVLEPSPHRVQPLCPLFGRCGGCQLQHLAYPAQTEIKAGWLAELLARVGIPWDLISPLRPSPSRYGYRFRVRLFTGPQGRLGFRAERSHQVVAVEACPIMSPELEELVRTVGRVLAESPPALRLEVEAGRLAGTGFVVLKEGIGGRGRPGRKGEELRRLAARLESRVKTRLGGGEVAVYAGRPGRRSKGPDEPPAGTLRLPLKGLEPALFPSVFAQAQAAQNQALVEAVQGLVRPGPGQRVLDLMAGMGNLSLSLARDGALVTAVEADPLACANGRLNAREYGLKMEFVNRPALDYLKGLTAGTGPRGGRFEAVVVDPPRRGIKDLLPHLVRLAPERLVYVSCQPATLARDLKYLVGQGYLAREILPLDLMPQTFHLETVVLLIRDSEAS